MILAEELNFTRAAARLHITQSALSKQITEIEQQNKLHLFIRENRRHIEVTQVGRIFAEEARVALSHIQRAVQLACAAREGSDSSLSIGLAPDPDPIWISTLLSIRLPLYPKLRIQLTSEFSSDLVTNLAAGELTMALVTGVPFESSQITSLPFSRSPLYAALPDGHPVAHKDRVSLEDLAMDDWILFSRKVHPAVHDAIVAEARREGIDPKLTHDTVAAHQAVQLVAERVGIAILTHPPALNHVVNNVILRPLSEASLCFETSLVLRADDRSRAANEFAKAFLQKIHLRNLLPRQMELSLSA